MELENCQNYDQSARIQLKRSLLNKMAFYAYKLGRSVKSPPTNAPVGLAEPKKVIVIACGAVRQNVKSLVPPKFNTPICPALASLFILGVQPPKTFHGPLHHPITLLKNRFLCYKDSMLLPKTDPQKSEKEWQGYLFTLVLHVF